MKKKYIQDTSFENLDSSSEQIILAEYESCTFKYCDFSNYNFSNFSFVDCEFNSCNLSLIALDNTSFRNVKSKQCKMLGLHFEHCQEFNLSFSFENTQLNHSSFYKIKIKKTIFDQCQLYECDFSESDLSNSAFKNCDLSGAIFDNTILEKVDLSSSSNYIIDPEKNRIKKAKFSLLGISGLLRKYDIEILEEN